MRRVLFLCVVGFVTAVITVAAQPPTMTSVATVKQLHAAMIKPSSDTIFRVSVEAPANEQEWIAVRRASVILAESGNLLMIGARVRDHGQWLKLSRGLGDAGAAALTAADRRDVTALLAAADRIIVVCESCHAPYRNQRPRMPVR
jgi:hypothetical protein